MGWVGRDGVGWGCGLEWAKIELDGIERGEMGDEVGWGGGWGGVGWYGLVWSGLDLGWLRLAKLERDGV